MGLIRPEHLEFFALELKELLYFTLLMTDNIYMGLIGSERVELFALEF